MRPADVERRLHSALERRLRRRGWRPRVVAYTGYGDGTWVRVLARVLLAPPDARAAAGRDHRGWRRFLTASASEVPVTVTVGEEMHTVTSGRDGYVDVRVPARLPSGWTSVALVVGDGPAVEAPVRVVGPETTLGVVSDVDDTVIVTMLPRPLIAFWNAFVVRESARRPVPGMAGLYQEVMAAQPDVAIVYLSTGAWNAAPAMARFLDRHGYPPGPLLFTDWGPDQEGWFRSGAAHKHRELRRLLEELPHVRWLLVGDDGQHDPEIYGETAARFPEAVLGVAIRQLSRTEQVLSHGTPVPHDPADGTRPEPCREVCGHDGHELRDELRRYGLVLDRA